MRLFVIFIYLVLTGICADGQNLVGFKGSEIRNYMRENCRDMIFNKVTNTKFSYFKYSDSQNSRTLLFFLNPDSVCKSVRLICDLNSKADKIKEFNSIYRNTGEYSWIDNRSGKDYLVKLKDDQWSCVITIEADK